MSSKEETYYIAGIDEAGYGPLLGPLVITSVVFETPRPEQSLWSALRGAVCRRACRSGRIQIADSKKLFTPAAGPGRLERGVLTCLRAGGMEVVETFEELLGRLCHHFGEPLDSQPWYSDLAIPLPVAADPEDISQAAAKLRAEMLKKGVALRDVCVNPVHPPKLNRLIRQRDNKATVLFEETMSLVRRLLHIYGRRGITITADRQGMRRYYEPLICQAFPMSRVDVISEEKKRSEYEIRTGDGIMRLSFVEKAEDAHLPVALASMCGKYVREVFMSAFNGYWRERVEGLRPTSGYPRDARRFLTDIQPAWDEAGVDRDQAVRAR